MCAQEGAIISRAVECWHLRAVAFSLGFTHRVHMLHRKLQAMTLPIGIDLGTTKSMAAHLGPGGSLVSVPAFNPLTSGSQSHLVPSAVYFGQRLLVGEAAMSEGLRDPEGLAMGFKRDMGKPHFQRNIRHCQVPPEVLSGFLLEYLANCVRRMRLDCSTAVITVPAHFDAKKRTATQQAAQLAGIQVLDILNEPTAAAIAAAHQVLLSDAQTTKPRHILVYDLGGGTFDVTLLELRGRIFRTLATGGDIHLGGMDFDDCIAQIICKQFKDRHGVDPSSDPMQWPLLWQLAKKTKHQLSMQTEVNVSCQFAGLMHGFVLRRSDFENAIKNHVARSISTTNDVVDAAGLSWRAVDDILLAGGSSRIPLIADQMVERFGRRPRVSPNPDELVAHGAALYAAAKSDQSFKDSSASFDIVNVNSHSLGVLGVDPATSLPTNKIIVPRNTALPATAKRECVTARDGQRTVRLRLLEGESENPKYCTVLGEGIVRLERPAPANTRVVIECHYQADGTITLSARLPDMQTSAHVELRRDGLAELESLNSWRSRLTTEEPRQDELPIGAGAKSPLGLPEVDRNDISSVLTRLDALYEHVGAAALDASLVPVRAKDGERLWRQLQHEIAALTMLIKTLENRSQGETDLTKRWKLSGDLANAKLACENAETLAKHCRIAIGRDCVMDRVLSAESQAYLEQIQRLQSILEDYEAASERDAYTVVGA